MGEDVGEDVLGGDLAGDGGEVMDGFAEVLGDEVAGNVLDYAVDDAFCRCGGLPEGFGMSDIGDEYLASGVLLVVQSVFCKAMFYIVDALPCAG